MLQPGCQAPQCLQSVCLQRQESVVYTGLQLLTKLCAKFRGRNN